MFLETVLNYQDFMYPNISPCPSLLLLKTATTIASLKLSLLSRRGNRSKDPDRRGVVWTEFANVLKLDFTTHSGVSEEYIKSLSFYVPVSNPAFLLTVSFCVHVMSVLTSFYLTFASSPNADSVSFRISSGVIVQLS